MLSYETHSINEMRPSVKFHENILYSIRDMFQNGWGTCYHIIALTLSQTKISLQAQCLCLVSAHLFGKAF